MFDCPGLLHRTGKKFRIRLPSAGTGGSHATSFICMYQMGGYHSCREASEYYVVKVGRHRYEHRRILFRPRRLQSEPQSALATGLTCKADDAPSRRPRRRVFLAIRSGASEADRIVAVILSSDTHVSGDHTCSCRLLLLISLLAYLLAGSEAPHRNLDPRPWN